MPCRSRSAMSDTLARRELVPDNCFEVRATSARSMIQCWQASPTANRRTLMEILGTNDGPMAGPATPMIERLMDVGIDGRGPFRSAQSVADFALAEHREVEPAIDAMVRSHLRLAAANGFVTGLGGFVAIPIALPANILGFYLVTTRLVAVIASSRGHDIGQPEVRSAILLALVGADADDLLAKASEAGAGKLVNLVAQRLPGPWLEGSWAPVWTATYSSGSPTTRVSSSLGNRDRIPEGPKDFEKGVGMAAAKSVRWGAFLSLANAFRTATRLSAPGVGARLTSLPRLVRATIRGEYAGTSRLRPLLIAGALLYLISPIDLVPVVFLPLIGLGGDAMIISWIAASLINETESFLRWESDRERIVRGYVVH